MILKPQHLKIFGNNISIGDYTTLITASDKQIDLSTWETDKINGEIQLGKYTDYGEEMPGAMKVVGTLSVSGNTFLGTNVQTTTVRNDIVVEDTLSVAGSVVVVKFQLMWFLLETLQRK